MATWQYGVAGDLWPVEVGDIWAVGPHRLICGDLEEDVADRALAKLGITPAMAYTDPPYNTNLATGFRTKAGMPRKVFFAAFLVALVRSHRRVTGDVYLEMGNATAGDLKRALIGGGAAVHDHWNITYYGKSPSALVRARFSSGKPVPLDLNGMDDEVTPEMAIRASSNPGDWVLDCCMGRGLTARSAQKAGRRSVGIELHPRRMAVTIAGLVKLGLEAEKAGTL
jgi:hypothetical protein